VSIGKKVQPKPRYSLGDAAEIANRDSTCFQNPESHFQQIRPGGSSKNLNEPSRGNRKGDSSFKWDQPY
jgi:hypothetical protein